MSGLPDNNATFVETFDNLLSTKDPVLLGGVAVAILVVLLTIIFFTCCRGSSSKRSVLLVGLCDAGKSLLFSKLMYAKYVATHTSMIENSGIYNVSSEKSSLTLIDIPGHERVRQQYFDKFKATARGIIFVIDSMTFQKEVKDVAELLYQVLSDKTIMKNSTSVLVACNKHDQGLAKGSRLIQSSLEKELNNVRKTRSGALEATDGNVSSAVFLGRRDRDFSFADLRPKQVEFVECSARGQDDVKEHNLEPIMDWLLKIA